MQTCSFKGTSPVGYLNSIKVENISSDLIAVFLTLQTLWPYSLAKSDFFIFEVFFRGSLQNKVDGSPFFLHF